MRMISCGSSIDGKICHAKYLNKYLAFNEDSKRNIHSIELEDHVVPMLVSIQTPSSIKRQSVPAVAKKYPRTFDIAFYVLFSVNI